MPFTTPPSLPPHENETLPPPAYLDPPPAYVDPLTVTQPELLRNAQRDYELTQDPLNWGRRSGHLGRIQDPEGDWFVEDEWTGWWGWFRNVLAAAAAPSADLFPMSVSPGSPIGMGGIPFLY